MTMRTTRKTVTFAHPFLLKGVDRTLPPGGYEVLTDEELIEGLSFPVYRRISTIIIVPGQSHRAVEMVTVDPLDLQATQAQDAATHPPLRADGGEPAPMNNLTSRHIDENESDNRGIKGGWYAMRRNGSLRLGPFSCQEECLTAIAQTPPEPAPRSYWPQAR